MFRVLFAPILRSTVAAYIHLCVYGFGMFVHWSRYWLGYPHTFSTVNFSNSSNIQLRQLWYLFKIQSRMVFSMGLFKYRHTEWMNFLETKEVHLALSLRFWRSRARILAGGENFHTRPDRPWGPPSLLYSGYGVFSGGKAGGAWRWSPTPSSSEVKQRVELYCHSGPSWPVLEWTVPLLWRCNFAIYCVYFDSRKTRLVVHSIHTNRRTVGETELWTMCKEAAGFSFKDILAFVWKGWGKRRISCKI
jgi:hypothetical protein